MQVQPEKLDAFRPLRIAKDVVDHLPKFYKVYAEEAAKKGLVVIE